MMSVNGKSRSKTDFPDMTTLRTLPPAGVEACTHKARPLLWCVYHSATVANLVRPRSFRFPQHSGQIGISGHDNIADVRVLIILPK